VAVFEHLHDGAPVRASAAPASSLANRASPALCNTSSPGAAWRDQQGDGSPFVRVSGSYRVLPLSTSLSAAFAAAPSGTAHGGGGPGAAPRHTASNEAPDRRCNEKTRSGGMTNRSWHVDDEPVRSGRNEAGRSTRAYLRSKIGVPQLYGIAPNFFAMTKRLFCHGAKCRFCSTLSRFCHGRARSAPVGVRHDKSRGGRILP
jgi:hypothetical protein